MVMARIGNFKLDDRVLSASVIDALMGALGKHLADQLAPLEVSLVHR